MRNPIKTILNITMTYLKLNNIYYPCFFQVIVMLGATAHICGHLIYAHAKTDKLWYVGATAAALGPCVAPLIRSMTSKVLPASERGLLDIICL